jgi:beta-glucosidase
MDWRWLAGGVTAVLLIGGAVAVTASPGSASACPWIGSTASPDRRADMVTARMSTADKVAMLSLHTSRHGYENTVAAIPRLCVPRLTLQDGPAGIADGATGVTQLPAPISLAATWSTGLARRYGTVIGQEARGKGIDVAQAPMINIDRVPEDGRSWESFGEDPYLTSELAVADIRGIQAQGVLADVKHLAANNQETDREHVDEQISQRTLHEIYLPAFEAAVTRANVASIMCAYNQINQKYACQDWQLLTGILRQQWGFKGFVRSDLGAVHSVAAGYRAGLDEARPGEPRLLTAAIRKHQVPMSTVDTAVHDVLREMFAYGLFAHPRNGFLQGATTTAAHRQLALDVAESGTVLLKNRGDVLPLSPRRLRSVAVIGPDSGRWVRTAGIGSAHVRANRTVTPIDGIREHVPAGTKVIDAPLWTGTRPGWTMTAAMLRQAARAARSAQIAVVFAGDVESEGRDRRSLTLPYDQDRLIDTVAAANPRTVVVLNTGGPVVMPWLSRVAGVVQSWYSGEEDGRAIAAVLFGSVDPCGKLPMTYPASARQTPTSAASRWRGVHGVAKYSEELDVGYRWYDAEHVKPLFPFGYGRSYTTFRLSGLTVARRGSTVEARLTVRDTGHRSGTAVVQAYLSYPRAAGEPPLQLRAAARIGLRAGQECAVSLSLPRSAFTYWDAGTWRVAAWRYRLAVGTSSANLPLRALVPSAL